MSKIDNKICGLGRFAEDASKAGYANPNGTVNLMDAMSIVKKYGKLVPKSELSKEDLQELKDVAAKLKARFAFPNRDTFVKE